MSDLKIATVLNHTCLLGEGPVWDAAQNRILWIDILRAEFHSFNVVENKHQIADTGCMIGSFALRNTGGIIAAMQDGINEADGNFKSFRRVIDPENDLPDNRFNEGKCDPSGRFWAGTMSLTDQPERGSLYMVDREFEITRKIANISISNGLAWNAAAGKMYFIDTPTYQVVQYDFNNLNGEITNRKTIISVAKEQGSPDGMTIDTEGMLWIAHWDGWQITRWNPETGELLMHIKMPAGRITSCTFGGNNFTDLYITSAKTGLTEQQLSEQPLAGSLFVIRNCGYQGFPPVLFAG